MSGRFELESHRYESDASIVGIDGVRVAFWETPTILPFEDGIRSILD